MNLFGIGREGARRNPVAPDAFGAKFAGQRFGKTDDGALGRRPCP